MKKNKKKFLICYVKGFTSDRFAKKINFKKQVLNLNKKILFLDFVHKREIFTQFYQVLGKEI